MQPIGSHCINMTFTYAITSELVKKNLQWLILSYFERFHLRKDYELKEKVTTVHIKGFF